MKATQFFTVGLDDDGDCNGSVSGPWPGLTQALDMKLAGQIITMPALASNGDQLHTFTRSQLVDAVAKLHKIRPGVASANSPSPPWADIADWLIVALDG